MSRFKLEWRHAAPVRKLYTLELETAVGGDLPTISIGFTVGFRRWHDDCLVY
jgi:hypothetical protein